MSSFVLFCRFIKHWRHWSHPYASSPHVVASGGGTAPSHVWPIFFSAPAVMASQGSGVFVVMPSQVSWITSSQSVSQHNDKWTMDCYMIGISFPGFKNGTVSQRMDVDLHNMILSLTYVFSFQKLQRHTGLKRIEMESIEEPFCT